MVHYKVWVHVEEIDEDGYRDVTLPVSVFKSDDLKVAEGFVDSLAAISRVLDKHIEA